MGGRARRGGTSVGRWCDLLRLVLPLFVFFMSSVVKGAGAEGADAAVAGRQQLPVTLAECIAHAIQTSMRLQVKRSEERLAELGVRAEKGAFYPELSLAVGLERTQEPTIYAYQDDSSSFAYTGLNYEGALAGRLPTGTEYKLKVGSSVYWNDQSVVPLYPYHSDLVRLELTQPLLRGWGIGNNLSQLEVARIGRGLSRIETEIELTKLLTTVIELYWQLVAQQEEVVVARKSLDLARDLVEATRRRLALGNLSRQDLIEAEAAMAKRQLEVVVAQRAVVKAEGALRQLVAGGGKTKHGLGDMRRILVPVDRPRPRPQHERRNLADLIQLARWHRPEIRASAQALAAQRQRVQTADNQALPRLDLEARVGLSSLAGAARDDNSNATPAAQQVVGNYGDGWIDLFRFRYPSAWVGLRLALPLHSTVRRREAQQAALKLVQLTAEDRELRQRVNVEVAQALSQVDLSVRQVDVAVRARTLAEEHLEAAEKRFRGGVSTSYDVLRVQMSVTEAQSDLIAARKDHEISRAALAAAAGELLSFSGVRLDGDRTRRGSNAN